MRKIICMVAAILMLLSVSACSTREKDEPNNVQNNAAVEREKNDDAKQSTSKVDLPMTYKVPLQAIVVDAPDYQQIECGYTQLFTVGRDYNIAITACLDDSASSVLDAHNVAFKLFQNNYQNYAKVNSLNVTSEKTLDVNGVDVYRFEGKLDCVDNTGEYSIFTVGYSFIMDGIPCSIEGIVLDKSQPQEMITEVRSTVDAMIQTLRSSK